MSLAFLKRRSSHLYGALRRVFPGEIPEPLGEIFQFALSAGGESEVGFDRDPEVSFNPRVARISLILLNECGVTELETLAAGMLSTVRGGVSSEGRLGEEISRLSLSEEFGCSRAANALRAALELDLGRHLHQLTRGEVAFPPFGGESPAQIISSYRARSPQVIEKAHTLTGARIGTLLERVVERYGGSNTERGSDGAD